MSSLQAVDPAELPDSLAAPIAAALAMPADPDDPHSCRRVLERLAWSVQAVRSTVATADAATFDYQVVVAAAQRHPGLAAWVARIEKLGPKHFGALCHRLLEAPPAYTELGLAERMVALRGCDLAWSPAVGGWLTWDGRRWVHDESQTAGLAAVKATVRGLVQDEVLPGDSDEAKASQSWARRTQGMQVMRPAVELAKSEPGISVPGDQWDADPALLAVANGTLELGATGARLRGHRRGDRLTRAARAEYDERASGSDWDRFVRKALPDAEVRGYAQRLVGYSLLGDNRHRRLIFLIGPTSTGKSTYLEALVHALGDHAGAFDLGLFRASKDGGRPAPTWSTRSPGGSSSPPRRPTGGSSTPTRSSASPATTPRRRARCTRGPRWCAARRSCR